MQQIEETALVPSENLDVAQHLDDLCAQACGIAVESRDLIGRRALQCERWGLSEERFADVHGPTPPSEKWRSFW